MTTATILHAKCTHADYNYLFDTVNRSRKSTEFISLKREAIFNLLQDHQMICDALKEHDVVLHTEDK